MATLEQIVQFSLALVSENTRRFGEKNSPTNLTVTGQVFDSSNITIADNFGNAILWTTGNGGLNTFSYLLFVANQDVVLEFANTTPNPDERALIRVTANAVLVMPSSIMGGYASNTSRLDGAVLVSGTDYNTITEIRVQRDAADLAGDATARLMLIF